MPPTKQLTKSVLLRQVNAFNRDYPQGTAVIVSSESGEYRTVIRQKAFVCDGLLGVACLTSTPFYCAIDRVRPAEAS
jgi:hypothetical protein